MNGNYTLKVLENIGVESKATFGEVYGILNKLIKHIEMEILSN